MFELQELSDMAILASPYEILVCAILFNFD